MGTRREHFLQQVHWQASHESYPLEQLYHRVEEQVCSFYPFLCQDRRQFCRHISTSECTLEMKVLAQSAVERWRCPYINHKLAYGMHTLRLRSHALLIRYAYVDKRYTEGDLCFYTLTTSANVTHTLPIPRLYVTRTLLYATHTFVTDRRRKRGHQHSKVVRISSFSPENFIRNSYVHSYAVVWLHL